MSDQTPYDILFLCTGNSARSILAESIMQRLGAGKFRAYSAGSHPKGEIHRGALKLLKASGYPVDHLRSKSWDEFEGEHAVAFDFIVTVCDNAAGEVCPMWPGKPIRAHWGVPDPAAVEGSESAVALAFAEAYRALYARIGLLTSLPLAELDALSVQREMDLIGQAAPAPPVYLD